MTTEVADIIADPEIDVLIELTGDVKNMIEPCGAAFQPASI